MFSATGKNKVENSRGASLARTDLIVHSDDLFSAEKSVLIKHNEDWYCFAINGDGNLCLEREGHSNV